MTAAARNTVVNRKAWIIKQNSTKGNLLIGCTSHIVVEWRFWKLKFCFGVAQIFKWITAE